MSVRTDKLVLLLLLKIVDLVQAERNQIQEFSVHHTKVEFVRVLSSKCGEP